MRRMQSKSRGRSDLAQGSFVPGQNVGRLHGSALPRIGRYSASLF
jgi:hypothetical protein